MKRLLVVLLCALTPAVPACVPEPAASDKCSWMTDAPLRPDQGRTSVLVDVSNSTRASARRPGAPDLAGAVREQLARAVERKDAVSIGSFSGPGAEPVSAGGPLNADYTTDNDRNEAQRREDAVACLSERFADAVRAAPAAAGTDVLGALRGAARWVREGGGARTVVLATDGLQTTGCADLTRAGFEGQGEIDDITAVCAERKEVTPDLLRDAELVLRGVGQPAVEHPRPDAAQQAWLEDLWRSLCRATGVAAERCGVAATTATGGDEPTAVAADVADPPVSFSARTLRYEVPGDVLFDTGLADLRPEAQATLTRIAVGIRTRAYRSIEVGGHTDSRAEPAFSVELGQRRADRVAEFLQRNGLSDITPVSYGRTKLKCPFEYPGGVEDPVALQCNRRVEIVVTLR
ncbi:OmpA family protein [Saccharothrix australiensis]|uniref:OmpA family protein n=1 Tax=Saccharothrix australiensis TaxID=2072 RepID=A0A495VZF8_9PSEU|nr:OmpA family protein [Saccharothrix australiensis]RKT54260.1 OmpA family protein [Saccharothrix australiensis]